MKKLPIVEIITFFFLLPLILPNALHAEETNVIEREEVIVRFQEPLGNAAQEIAQIYLPTKKSLEKKLGWKLGTRPTIFLMKDSNMFQKATGSNLIAAFAVPRKNLIVIDYPRMKIYPFTLGSTLKHELCHLLLHHHIKADLLPKWLDEGVAQWVSDGMAEVMIDRKHSVLNEAILSGRHLPLRLLSDSFPEEKTFLLLAYEESKSFVEYIRDNYGDQGIQKILKNLKNGDSINEAIHQTLTISFEELEQKWLKSLKRKVTWFSYLSSNLYEILFFIAALITIIGFIKILIKKRSYKDETWDDE